MQRLSRLLPHPPPIAWRISRLLVLSHHCRCPSAWYPFQSSFTRPPRLRRPSNSTTCARTAHTPNNSTFRSKPGKPSMVQIRPAEDGLLIQQMLFADEVRSLKDLHIEHADVSDAELQLALQIIDQAAEENYDPTQYEDEEKKRVLKAIDEKIAGKNIVTPEQVEVSPGGQVIDLMEALRASLAKRGKTKAPATKAETPAGDVAVL